MKNEPVESHQEKVTCDREWHRVRCPKCQTLVYHSCAEDVESRSGESAQTDLTERDILRDGRWITAIAKVIGAFAIRGDDIEGAVSKYLTAWRDDVREAAQHGQRKRANDGD